MRARFADVTARRQAIVAGLLATLFVLFG